MHRTAWALAVLTGLVVVPATLPAQVRIPEVKTRGKTPCEIHPETAAATADLWVSAQAALTGSASTDSNPPLLLIQKWRKTLGRRLNLIYERKDTSLVATRQPFWIKPPASLERAGYIQHMLNTVYFYGPDPDEILTDAFLRRHCFRRVEGTNGSQGLSGLGFEPLPRQPNPDVAGVLWIDPVTRDLRSVEYRWTNAPGWAEDGSARGSTEFVRLAEGGWVIQRWYIRLPRSVSGTVYQFDGYTEEGGELLAVGPPTPVARKAKP